MPRPDHLAQRVPSDSGVLCIIDPFYLAPEDAVDGKTPKWYQPIADEIDMVGDLKDFQTKHSGVFGGVMFRTGTDGSFQVYTVRDEDGRVVRVVIDLETGSDEVIEDYEAIDGKV